MKFIEIGRNVPAPNGFGSILDQNLSILHQNLFKIHRNSLTLNKKVIAMAEILKKGGCYG